MAHKKAAGSTKNLRDSNPKYLGIKLHDGNLAKAGSIIVRQRGTVVVPGANVKLGRDHTLFAVKPGVVKFRDVRKTKFDGSFRSRKSVSVV